MITRILKSIFGSVQFRELNALICGWALGMFMSFKCWRQIKATRDIWGVDADEWTKFLLGAIVATGATLSVTMTVVAAIRAKGKDDDKNSDTTFG